MRQVSLEKNNVDLLLVVVRHLPVRELVQHVLDRFLAVYYFAFGDRLARAVLVDVLGVYMVFKLGLPPCREAVIAHPHTAPTLEYQCMLVLFAHTDTTLHHL